MPLDRPGAEVGGAEPDQLAVGVDLVVVPGGVGLGRAEPLGEADQHHADGRGRRGRGSRGARRPAGRATAGRGRCGRRSRRRGARGRRRRPPRSPSSTATSEPGTIGAHAPSPSTIASEQHADDERGTLGVAELGDDVPELLEEVAARPSRRRTASGSWPTMIVSARPTMKPLSTGSEMKLARKPSRSRPATSAMSPGGDRERRGQRREAVVPPGGERRPRSRPTAPRWPTSARRPGAASCRTRRRGQRPGRGVQADDRRDAGDRRVGERLRAPAPPRPSGRRAGRRAATPGR